MNPQHYYSQDMNRSDGYSDNRSDRMQRNSMPDSTNRGIHRELSGNMRQFSNAAPRDNFQGMAGGPQSYNAPTAPVFRSQQPYNVPNYDEYPTYQDSRHEQYYPPPNQQFEMNVNSNNNNSNFAYGQGRSNVPGRYVPPPPPQRSSFVSPHNNMSHLPPQTYIPPQGGYNPPPMQPQTLRQMSQPQNIPMHAMYNDMHRASTSLPIGSNAQGRAVNKMLLDLLKERIVDPQKLNLAIETFVDRMDCVNLATLLFHTGKKRMPMLPYYVKLIADRFQTLAQEELRAREASNALYGLKCFTADIPEVRELVFALANKIQTSKSAFVAQAVGNALYGLQNLSSDYEEVRYLLVTLSSKVNDCQELLEAQNIGNALYGLRNMNSDYREVRVLISALTPKIANAREELNGQALGNSLYGLQSMSSKEVEVRSLLTVLATKVNRAWEELKAQEVGNALYGLKRMHSEYVEVRLLIASLVPRVASSPELLDAQAIGNSFYGLQNMKSDNPEILSLLKILAQKVMISSPELDGQAMGNALYGLQGMNSEYNEVQEVIQALTQKIQQSTLDMNAQELGNALYGMQNMSSSIWVVRQLLVCLAHKISTSKQELGSQEIGNALFGVQRMSTQCAETRILVKQLTQKIYHSHQTLDPQGISNSLYGLQTSSNECREIQQLIDILNIKIEPCWKILSPHHIAYAVFGLQYCTNQRTTYMISTNNHNNNNNHHHLTGSSPNTISITTQATEIQQCVAILINKIIICREEMTFKQVAFAFYGLQSMTTIEELSASKDTATSNPASSSFAQPLIGMITALTEKLSLSSSIGQVLSTVTMSSSHSITTPTMAGNAHTPLHHTLSSSSSLSTSGPSHSGMTSLGSHSLSNHAISLHSSTGQYSNHTTTASVSSSATSSSSSSVPSTSNHIGQYGYYLSLLLYGLQGISSLHHEITILFQVINQKILHPLYGNSTSTSPTTSSASSSYLTTSNMSNMKTHPSHAPMMIPPPLIVPPGLTSSMQSSLGSSSLSSSSQPSQPLGLDIALFTAQDIGNILYGFQHMSTLHSSEIAQFFTFLLTPIQQIDSKRMVGNMGSNSSTSTSPSSSLHSSTTPITTSANTSGKSFQSSNLLGLTSPWSIPICKNTLFGIQQCSVHHPTIHYLIHILFHAIQEYFHIIQDIATSTGFASVLEPSQVIDLFQEMMELYQILVMVIPQVPDMSEYVSVFNEYTVLISDMETFLQDHEQYLRHSMRLYTTLEGQLAAEVSSMNMKKVHVQRGVIIGGFEVPLMIHIPTTTNNSSPREEKIVLEIEGTSYSYPAKRRFYQLRNQYLESQQGVTVLTIPKDFLLATSSTIQGLCLYAEYVGNTTGPHAASTMPVVEQRRYTMLQTLVEVFRTSPSLPAQLHSGMNASMNASMKAEYVDDEISLTALSRAGNHPTTIGAIAAATVSSSHLRRPYGITTGWIGKRPVFSSSSLSSTSSPGNTIMSPMNGLPTPTSTTSSVMTPNHSHGSMSGRKSMLSSGYPSSATTIATPPHAMNTTMNGYPPNMMVTASPSTQSRPSPPPPPTTIPVSSTTEKVSTTTASTTAAASNTANTANYVSRLVGYMSSTPPSNHHTNTATNATATVNSPTQSSLYPLTTTTTSASSTYDHLLSGDPKGLSSSSVSSASSASRNMPYEDYATHYTSLITPSSINAGSTAVPRYHHTPPQHLQHSQHSFPAVHTNGSSTVDELVYGYSEDALLLVEERSGYPGYYHSTHEHSSESSSSGAAMQPEGYEQHHLEEAGEGEGEGEHRKEDELAFLEKQLEIAKLEAKIHSLRLQKQQPK